MSADPQQMATEHELVDPDSDLDWELEKGRHRCVAVHDVFLGSRYASVFIEQVGFHLPELTGCNFVRVLAFLYAVSR